MSQAGATDEEVHKITWQNASRFFNWDPFLTVPKDQGTVGALRALAKDIDTTCRPKEEWRRRNEEAGIGRVPQALAGEVGSLAGGGLGVGFA